MLKSINAYKNKIIYYVLTAAAAVIWLSVSVSGSAMSDLKAEKDIYIAGMPDYWPLEYYDGKAGVYKGVIPELLHDAGSKAGITLHYMQGSGEDLRLELAENIQVDAVCTEGITDEALREAGLEKGPCLISFESGKRESIYLAYTKSMPEEYKEILEDAFEREEAPKVNELLLKYAGERKEEDRKEKAAKMILPVVILAVITAFIIFWILLRKKEKQIEELAYTDDITGGENFAAWKRKYEGCVRDGSRDHYAVVYLYPGIEAVSHIYGYEEAARALNIVSDTIAPLVSRESES